jgi:hypothetical protein
VPQPTNVIDKNAAALTSLHKLAVDSFRVPSMAVLPWAEADMRARIYHERQLRVYLNEGFEGGETIVDQTRIEPRQGLALFFGHRILHKGMPVIAGRKYVLRTDVMFRRRSSEADQENGAP